MSQLAPVLTAHQASEVARRKLRGRPELTAPELVHYPMAGIVFTLRARRGPAARMDGQRFYTVVDKATRQAFTSDPFVFVEDTSHSADIQAAPAEMLLDDAVAVAKNTLAVRLLRRMKLASSFELVPDHVVDPLWKPNWYMETATERVLIDGLNGGFTACAKRLVNQG